uniref:RICIN domain-containing protein n=1 Tax=Streptomyces fulvoviolaceus TaxID=285535 RepID=UPI003B832150
MRRTTSERPKSASRLRRWAHWAIAWVVAVPILVIGASAGPAQAATPTAGGTYTLAVTKSGMCLDVVDMSTANKALVQQWNC